MKFLILAGGHGTRIFPFSELVPKCLLPVAGVPCVYRIAKRVLDQGYEPVLCINRWMEDQFRFAFRDLDVEFSISPEPMGTAGEIHYWATKSRADGSGMFMLQYGDDLTEIDYRQVLQFHRIKKCDVTLAATTKVALEVGVLDHYHTRLDAFHEKPMLGKPIWTSIAALGPVVLNYLGPGLDMARDIFPKMIKEERRIFVYETDVDWIDIGNIGHYRRANELYSGRKEK